MINKLIVGMLQYLPKNFVWIFSKRYIAGENLKDAVKVTEKVQQPWVLRPPWICWASF